MRGWWQPVLSPAPPIAFVCTKLSLNKWSPSLSVSVYKYIFSQDPPLAAVVWQLSVEMSKQGFDFIPGSLLMHLTHFQKLPLLSEVIPRSPARDPSEAAQLTSECQPLFAHEHSKPENIIWTAIKAAENRIWESYNLVCAGGDLLYPSFKAAGYCTSTRVCRAGHAARAVLLKRQLSSAAQAGN